MLRQFRGRNAWMVVPLAWLLTVNPLADAAGGRGGHGGGHTNGGHHSAPRPPSHSAVRAPAHRPSHPTHVASPAPKSIGNVAHNSSVPHNNVGGHKATGTQNNIGPAHGVATHNGKVQATGANPSMSLAARVATIHPSTYAYHTGSTVRHYRPSGYGRGYRNRYYGNSRNYGRSQTNDRSLVARLRSVHATLTRMDHDYRGHRVRAAHQISLAIRHLSHRSRYSNSISASGQANGFLTGMNGTRRQTLSGNTNGTGQRVHLTQAQSDSRMAQALRTTQGVTMQLNHQGQNNNTHRLAHAQLQHAMHEMNLALASR